MVYEDDEDDGRKPRAIEPETVTLEAFFEALKGLQHLQELSELEDNAYLRKAVRLALCTVTPERIICALDKAAESPDWWRVNRLHIYCPEMSHAEIAHFLKIRKNAVKHQINHVGIPSDAYEALPPLPKY